MSYSDSQLSAGSSRIGDPPAMSDTPSGDMISRVQRERKRKGKKKVESSSSEQIVGTERVQTIDSPETTSRLAASVASADAFVARPPLLMINIPRVATDELPSQIREGELERLRVTFHIPTNVEIRVPGADFRASRPPVGWRCCFEDQLKGGLRFPIHPFICEVLNYFRIPLAQVVPNGMRIVVRFMLSCRQQSVKPTIELFRYFFQLKKAVQASGCVGFSSRGGYRVLTPDNNTGWKPRYFFFRTPGLNLLEEWNYNVGPDRLVNRDTNKPKNYERLTILEAQNGKKFTEDELIEHGLSPAALPPKKGKGKPKPGSGKTGRYDGHTRAVRTKLYPV